MISPLSKALTDAGLVFPNDAKPELKFFFILFVIKVEPRVLAIERYFLIKFWEPIYFFYFSKA